MRPDVRQTDWLRFDDEIVTPVKYADVVADAYGGNQRTRRKRSRRNGFNRLARVPGAKRRRRDLFRRIFSLFRWFRRVSAMIAGTHSPSVGEYGFGYGGRSSSAYMIQYVRRSEVPKLYLDEREE